MSAAQSSTFCGTISRSRMPRTTSSNSSTSAVEAPKAQLRSISAWRRLVQNDKILERHKGSLTNTTQTKGAALLDSE
eukprot:CAMPEP_0181182584 /NCGR_PEP_ID=MMETSP1096-20121128/7970_1 /TAXON_ID=156174 ORGANISM="Chrysochromulina ericina, Strain CCMP281" /NCGR_SAMPLE_ID=MMETSP1096 /ASSEMBLY_ACC=CAM_ASM_000453 /LENGTH=76 /DNA_ID=CAMNT_0023271207 /DNA_START=528 /DNA_END=758 /DNA_ORIENTATION=-